MNTPKSDQIDELFREAIGIDRISDRWTWNKVSADQARSKLDKYVELRGNIAHRGSSLGSVRRNDVTKFFEHIQTIASKTGGAVNGYVRKITGKPLWVTNVVRGKKGSLAL